MTQPTRPPIRNLVPDNAPFTPEQRTWLNGFFAGFLELGDAGISARRKTSACHFGLNRSDAGGAAKDGAVALFDSAGAG